MSDQHSRAKHITEAEEILNREAERIAEGPAEEQGEYRRFAVKINLETGEATPVDLDNAAADFLASKFEPAGETTPPLDELREYIKRLETDLYREREGQAFKQYITAIEEEMSRAEVLIEHSLDPGCCPRCKALRTALLGMNYAVGPLLTVLEALNTRLVSIESRHQD